MGGELAGAKGPERPRKPGRGAESVGQGSGKSTRLGAVPDPDRDTAAMGETRRPASVAAWLLPSWLSCCPPGAWDGLPRDPSPSLASYPGPVARNDGFESVTRVSSRPA